MNEMSGMKELNGGRGREGELDESILD